MDVAWEDDYDFVTDKIIPNGVPICPVCKEPAYETDKCVFCGQKFNPDSFGKGNLPPEPISYTSKNGYTGVLYGRHSFAIHDKNGKEVFHMGARSFDTYEEMVKEVDNFPEFLKLLRGNK